MWVTCVQMLAHEVPLRAKIEGPALVALTAMVKAMMIHLPGPHRRKSALHELWKWLSTRDGDGSILGLEWKAEVERRLTAAGIDVHGAPSWRGCRGSTDAHRGYPCGLWTTFHVLTIAPSFVGGAAAAVESLDAVISYVSEFFGCGDCVHNFATETAGWRDSIAAAAPAMSAPALFLWEVHNKVNARLGSLGPTDAGNDPEHPKVQFPSDADCHACRQLRTRTGGFEWNRDEVFGWLARHYAKHVPGAATAVAALMRASDEVQQGARGSAPHAAQRRDRAEKDTAGSGGAPHGHPDLEHPVAEEDATNWLSMGLTCAGFNMIAVCVCCKIWRGRAQLVAQNVVGAKRYSSAGGIPPYSASRLPRDVVYGP